MNTYLGASVELDEGDHAVEVRASDGARIQHKRIGVESGEELAFKDLEK